MRIALGVIVGFVAWTVLWVGGNQVLGSVSPAWYGAHEIAFEKAWMNKTAFDADMLILVIHLLLSFAASLIAGYLAAIVAGEVAKTTLVLSVLLIVMALVVFFLTWNLLPLWYFLIFTLLLLPVTSFGGRMKKT